MSQTATFYLANWKPLEGIVRAGGGSEAIWRDEFQAREKNFLVARDMSDAHEQLSAWQAVADLYRMLVPKIDEEQASMIGELLNGFGILFDESPDDLSHVNGLEVGPLPRGSFITTLSISPDSIAYLLSSCFDIDWKATRKQGEQLIKEMDQQGDITWIQSFDEFMSFCQELIQLLKEAKRWSAGIVVWAG